MERDENMGSKQKKTQMGRKEYFERRLKERLSFLAEKKTEPSSIDKDPSVKNLRANIRAIDARLQAIAKIEQRTAELAKAKAEKTAAILKPQEGGKDKEKEKKEKGKEKAKEKGKEKEPKKAPEEGKEKKKKKEKEEKQAGTQDSGE
jgi:hypothetical protein